MDILIKVLLLLLWWFHAASVEGQASSGAAKYNAALGRTTWQSSWQYEGNPYIADTPDYGKSLKAVDGNTDPDFTHNSCTHTASVTPPGSTIWWSVDLGVPQRVQSVKLYNRLRSSERLQQFTIYGTTYGHTPEDAGGKQTCASRRPPLGSGASKDFTCDGKLIARYIIVEKDRLETSNDNILNLCEAEAYVCRDQNCANCTETRCEACDSGYRLARGRCTECSAGYYGNECIHTCSGHCKDNVDCDKVTGECLDCVDGYYGERCSQPCSEHCKDNAVCDKVTGNCPNGECEPGYRGRHCSITCRDGSYGDWCAQACPSTCRNPQECHNVLGHCPACADGYTGEICEHRCPSNCRTPDCDQVTGHCSACEDGFTGEKCEHACGLGRYGEVCAGVCSGHCADGDGNNCNYIDGSCPSCQPGYQGDKCDSVCRSGNYGQDCSTTCSENCKDYLVCDHIDGHCDCGHGYKGTTCTESCSREHFEYGENCESRCSENCGGDGKCNVFTGRCEHCNAGYMGEYCDEECHDGSYGDGCAQTCPSTCRNPQECDYVTGHCPACADGFTGEMCEHACGLGRYGEDCFEVCSGRCADGEGNNCHSIDGSCRSCQLGYQGDKCDSECSRGRFGQDCSETCPENCKQTGVCDHIDGHCDCGEGYKGDTCKDQCSVEAHEYGVNCASRCSLQCGENGTCSVIDGVCDAEICQPGYVGKYCSKAIGGQYVVITVVACTGAVVVLAIVATGFVVLMIQRRRRIEGNKPDQQENGADPKSEHRENRADTGNPDEMYLTVIEGDDAGPVHDSQAYEDIAEFDLQDAIPQNEGEYESMLPGEGVYQGIPKAEERDLYANSDIKVYEPLQKAASKKPSLKKAASKK